MVVLKVSSPLRKQSLIVPIVQSIRRPLIALTAIHRRYGDLVLADFFKKKILFVCKPEHIEEVYCQEAKGLLSRDFLYAAKKSVFGDGLVNSKNDIWVNQRRIMQPLFTKEAVIDWEKVIINEADFARNKLNNTTDRKINLSYELKDLIQRIFIRVLMGRSVETLSNKDLLISSIDTISNGLLPQLVTQIISNKTLLLLMPHKKRQYLNAVNHLTDFVNQEIDNKYKQPGHDLISLLIQAKDNKTNYTMTKDLLK